MALKLIIPFHFKFIFGSIKVTKLNTNIEIEINCLVEESIDH